MSIESPSHSVMHNHSHIQKISPLAKFTSEKKIAVKHKKLKKFHKRSSSTGCKFFPNLSTYSFINNGQEYRP